LIRGCSNEQNIAHQTREQKKCFKFLIECLMAFKFYQTRSNSTKQGVQKNGHQTMFDGVWSPNISRLSRPLHSPWYASQKAKTFRFVFTLFLLISKLEENDFSWN